MATLDPSVFYRDFGGLADHDTGAQHLSAAATRLAFSIVYSITELPDAIWQQFKELLTPIPCGVWPRGRSLAHRDDHRGPIGAAINGLLAAYGLYELWPVVKAVVGDWAWLRTRTTPTRKRAARVGQALRGGAGKGGITTLEAIVTHRVFHGAANKIRERFPTPDWLRRGYAEQETKRSSRRVDEETRRKRRTIEETLQVPHRPCWFLRAAVPAMS